MKILLWLSVLSLGIEVGLTIGSIVTLGTMIVLLETIRTLDR